jgi:cobyrinic acid a,c-diamide synthase
MQSDATAFPRIIIAALRGGSGKTILSIGLIAALNKAGQSIAPFKKGPDYIDAGWLALAAGRPCYNLDSFLLSQTDNLKSFLNHSTGCGLSVIEGNRGLYDGIDLSGSTSTAELAKLLKAPVVLCVDCTKITRTMAAVVAGCCRFDPEVMIQGVILNRVANARHEQKLRDSIEHYCRLPVLGAIPKLGQQHFPERHLGLVPSAEHDWATGAIDAVRKIAEQHLDLSAIEAIACRAPELNLEIGNRNAGKKRRIKDKGNATRIEVRGQTKWEWGSRSAEVGMGNAETSNLRSKPRIGIIKDSAFQFYYPENIEALQIHGAEVVFISPLKDAVLPKLNGLYIGGGFPETHARQLAANRGFCRQLKDLAQDGFPIYAECGGLMYLGEKMVLEGKSYPMVGILPLVFDFFKRPQGHGYVVAKVELENPYYPVGSEIKGHEFHYSRVSEWTDPEEDALVFRMQRGAGIRDDRDGMVYKNVLATYIHVHALGTPGWAPAMVRNAMRFKRMAS